MRGDKRERNGDLMRGERECAVIRYVRIIGVYL